MREPIDPRIGERVLIARRRKGWNQGELAAATTMSRTVISQLEKGKQKVSAERLRILALLLDVSADYLLGLEGEAPSELGSPAAPGSPGLVLPAFPVVRPEASTIPPGADLLRQEHRAQERARLRRTRGPRPAAPVAGGGG